MQLDSLIHIATVMLAAVSVSGTAMRSSQLAKEFPKLFDDGNAMVEHFAVESPLVVEPQITIVTLNSGGSFYGLFDLSYELPIAGKPRLAWCRYEGFDQDYHYAQGIPNPREIYRVRKELVDPDQLWRGLVGWEFRGREGIAINIPVSHAAYVYLSRANLDRTLIPIFPSDFELPE